MICSSRSKTELVAWNKKTQKINKYNFVVNGMDHLAVEYSEVQLSSHHIHSQSYAYLTAFGQIVEEMYR